MSELRPSHPTPGAQITGLGVYRPSRVVSNAEVCLLIDSSDAWIRERSGIIERRYADPDVDVVSMGTVAAQGALAHAGRSAAEVDLFITATISHMQQTPAASPQIAANLGSTAAAFDLGAACSGFGHALAMANDAIRAGSANHVLVIGAEKMTDLIDPRDRSSAFIFADGAGAVLVSGSERPGIGPVVWGSDGSKSELIAQDHAWTELRAEDGTVTPAPVWPTMKMLGPSVFRWAVWGMVPVATQAVEAAGITLEDLSSFIPHQANNRITDAMVKQLHLPAHVAIARDIQHSGNTTAASIPLAMHAQLTEHPELAGQLALLLGFGAGLAYAAQVVRLPQAPPP